LLPWQRAPGVVRCGNYGYLAMDEVGHHSRQSIGLIPRPAIFDQNIAALDKTGFAQAQAKCRHQIGPRLWTLGEPFFALRTCSRPVVSSTCDHCRSQRRHTATRQRARPR
jgi:hypothetical protein